MSRVWPPEPSCNGVEVRLAPRERRGDIPRGTERSHAWQSVSNAKVYVENIASAFCSADAEGCSTFEANAAAYLHELTALDAEIRQAVEPFSTLDEVTGRTLRKELLSVWEQDQRTVIFVTHSIKEALFLADRIFILTKGPAELLRERVVELPRPRDYDDPKLAESEAAIVREVMGPWGYK